jgi:outer membrane protein
MLFYPIYFDRQWIKRTFVASNQVIHCHATTFSAPSSACFILTIHAQSTVSTWNLETCINYALQHNIQVQQANIGVESSKIDLLTAKAARMPSLNVEVSQTFSNSKVPTLDNQYVNQSQLSGRYSLSAGLVLFDGNQISKNIQQQRLQVSSNELTVQQTKNSIVVAITQAYLQILYDNDCH